MNDSPTALVIAPHPDDEVLGAGGTIARLADAGVRVSVVTVCADLPPLYDPDVAPMVEAEARHAHRVLGVAESTFLGLASVEVSRGSVAELNGGIQQVLDRVRPDLVLAPFPDRHVDHKAVFDAAMVAARPVGAGRDITALALYETISETHWNAPGAEPVFAPTWNVDITASIGRKVEAFSCFESQVQPFPGPRSVVALEALSVFRGSQAGMGHAEAFQLVRWRTGAGQGDWSFLA